MKRSAVNERLGTGANLQCTTMGPASVGLQALTLRRKARMGVGYSGTPWSGQAMNCNCLTSRFSLEPFCLSKVGERRLSGWKCGNLLYERKRQATFYLVKGKSAHTVSCQLNSVKHGHLDHSVSLCATNGPILVTLDLFKRTSMKHSQTVQE